MQDSQYCGQGQYLPCAVDRMKQCELRRRVGKSTEMVTSNCSGAPSRHDHWIPDAMLFLLWQRNVSHTDAIVRMP
ncbi:MAG: hypothetical protein ACE5FA_12450, partial [Dehalococcoidia bacterium]